MFGVLNETGLDAYALLPFKSSAVTRLGDPLYVCLVSLIRLDIQGSSIVQALYPTFEVKVAATFTTGNHELYQANQHGTNR